MTPYYDELDRKIAVARGLGDEQGDWWIVARGQHRVKSPALPPRRTPMECQRDLERYAAKRGWRPLTICELHGAGP